MDLKRILVLTGDHQIPDPTKWDGRYAKEDLEVHRVMCEALTSLGRWELAECSDHAALMTRLRESPPELVVNFCDTGFRNVATHELHVPALLELFDVPYTGAPPQALVLAYDKAIVNLLAASIGIPVPRECSLEPGASLDSANVPYPAFVKPAQGDGSVGISRGSLVNSDEELRRQIEWLRNAVPGRAALIQEYLPGREFGLALVGNPGNFRPLPMHEVDYSGLPTDVPPILDFESKAAPSNPREKVVIAKAELEQSTVAELVDRAQRLFERIGCRDYARFDFRTAADGTIKLMEVNPNPAWSHDGKLAMMARFAGIAYPQLLEMLIDVAWARVTSKSGSPKDEGGRASE